MVHEFLITEKYAIVPDLPLEFDPKGAIKEKRFVFYYNKKSPARYGIWPRDSKTGKDVKWFEVDTHYVFHFGGTWDEINEKGESVVIMYALTWEEIQIGLQTEHVFGENDYQKLEKFVFNMSDLSVKRTVLIEGMNIEFPIINQHYYGHKSRYLYMSCRHQGNKLPEVEGDRDNAFFTGLVKFDQQTDKIVGKISFGDTHSGGEVYY